MRLLYVCSDYGIRPSGTKGASVHLRSITRALADLGNEISLLSPLPGPHEDHPVHRLPSDPASSADECPVNLKRWLTLHGWDGAVAREFRSLAYNVSAGSRAADALADRPPEAIVERLSLHSHVGADLAERWGVPLVVEVNALLTEEANRFRSLHLADLARRIERSVLDRADALVVVSRALSKRITELGVRPEKIHIVPNGVDVERFDAAPPLAQCRADLGLTDEFVVGFAGSLKIWHGVDVLLDAFGRFAESVPNAKLLIVGRGPCEDLLRQHAERLGRQGGVRFTGAVPHERVPSFLRAMDVAVAPFLPLENFYFSPIKLFEYMASGACVIASRLGQISEVIRDGVNGLLCTPGSADALCCALTRLHTAPAERRAMADRARADVRADYTWRRAAERTAAVIETLLAKQTAERASGTPHDRVRPATVEMTP